MFMVEKFGEAKEATVEDKATAGVICWWGWI